MPNTYAYADRVCARLAARVRELREAAGLSAYELWRRSGVSRTMIGRIEQGKTIPTFHTAARLAAALGVTIAEMVGTLDEPVPRRARVGSNALKVKEVRQTAATRLAAIEGGKASAATAVSSNVLLPNAPLVTRSAAPIDVAAVLEIGTQATNPGPNTIAFEAPKGDGRSGARGILLKCEPGNGSTRSFKYARSKNANGAQIIHPLARGHAIVHLGAKSLALSPPKAWAEIGWRVGDPKSLRTTRDFDKIFPLVDGQEYEILSRMSPGGTYELFLDGKVVATSPDPLSLEIAAGQPDGGAQGFKGPELPLKWSPGWAGLILGPADRSQHRARDLRFTPAVADASARR